MTPRQLTKIQRNFVFILVWPQFPRKVNFNVSLYMDKFRQLITSHLVLKFAPFLWRICRSYIWKCQPIIFLFIHFNKHGPCWFFSIKLMKCFTLKATNTAARQWKTLSKNSVRTLSHKPNLNFWTNWNAKQNPEYEATKHAITARKFNKHYLTWMLINHKITSNYCRVTVTSVQQKIIHDHRRQQLNYYLFQKVKLVEN